MPNGDGDGTWSDGECGDDSKGHHYGKGPSAGYYHEGIHISSTFRIFVFWLVAKVMLTWFM